MINKFDFRNVRACLDALFLNNNFVFVNDENIFKIQDPKTKFILYSITGESFIISNDGHEINSTELWKMVEAFADYVFAAKCKEMCSNYSALEGTA